MSGRIIAAPERVHHCSPGWTYSEAAGGPPFFFAPGMMSAHPPEARCYPKGTVWECDDCGRTWVSTGPPNNYSPGMVEFRPERRRERRRRGLAR